MKAWIVWANNGESYEDNFQDIWAVCGSEDAAKLCIANAHEQIMRDEKRLEELYEISETRELTNSELKERDQIFLREYCTKSCNANDNLPYFSIREYEIIN